MNIMTKRGQLDNIVVYEHYCDTTADLANIPSQYTTLGSIALVIHDDNANGLEVYMATTEKEWVPILNGGSGDDGNIVDVHICTSDEYDAETGKPTIENPIEGQFYLVPSTSGSASDMFDEWFYTNGAWEKFGSAGTAVDVPQSDWNQNDSTATDYIKNRPFYSEPTTIIYEGDLIFRKTSTETYTYNTPITLSETLQPSESYIFTINGDSWTQDHLNWNEDAANYYANSPRFNNAYYYSVNFRQGTTANPLTRISIFGQYLDDAEIGTTTTLHFSIAKPAENIHKIDAKYLYQVDWNQNDSTAIDYIKNRTHWEEYTFNESFNETLTFTSSQANMLLWNASTPYTLSNADITAIYKITIGDYTYTAQPILRNSNNQFYTISDESQNYNVGLQIQNNNIIVFTQVVIFNTSLQPSSYLVKIEQSSSIIHKIDSKYLPTPNWLAASTDNGYIDNKPNIIKASGQNSIVMNDVQNNSAVGSYSIASGRGTVAIGECQHVIGTYNQPNPYMIEIVGYGTDDANRKNIRTIDYSGNESLAGALTLGLGTADETTITAAQLKALLALLNT